MKKDDKNPKSALDFEKLDAARAKRERRAEKRIKDNHKQEKRREPRHQAR